MQAPWQQFLACGLWLALGLVLAGCGGGDSTESEPEEPVEPPPAVLTESRLKWRAADTLPAVGEHAAADDRRIEIAGPEGWIKLPDDPKYLARFSEKADQLPPWITVFAADSPLPILGDMRDEAESLEKFRKVLDDEVKKSPNPRVQEDCKPMKLGDVIFIRHVRLKSGAGIPLVVQSLQTVQGGRLYTVELTCRIRGPDREDYADSLTEYRDQAYAVAANLKFISSGAEAAAAAPPTESAKEKP